MPSPGSGFRTNVIIHHRSPQRVIGSTVRRSRTVRIGIHHTLKLAGGGSVSPYALRHQHVTFPSDSSAQLWSVPAATKSEAAWTRYLARRARHVHGRARDRANVRFTRVRTGIVLPESWWIHENRGGLGRGRGRHG